MEFRPIAGFPNGWRLGYRVYPNLYLLYPELPCFKTPDGRFMTPAEAAATESGPLMFHHTKKWLDIADQRYGGAAQAQPDWRAVDKAKMAMEDVLIATGRMSDELLDTGVGEQGLSTQLGAEG